MVAIRKDLPSLRDSNYFNAIDPNAKALGYSQNCAPPNEGNVTGGTNQSRAFLHPANALRISGQKGNLLTLAATFCGAIGTSRPTGRLSEASLPRLARTLAPPD